VEGAPAKACVGARGAVVLQCLGMRVPSRGVSI